MTGVGESKERQRSLDPGQRSKIGLVAIVAFAALAEVAAAIPVEPLVLRVQDAIGEPGGPAAIVFRTYASRPIRRGRIATGATPALHFGEVSNGLIDPIASYDGGQIFSPQGDVIGTFVFDPDTQSVDAQFESASASINSQDGVFGVLFVTLAAGVVPGTEYEIAVDAGLSFLTDPADNVIAIEPRPGRLRIRAASDPLDVGVSGGTVQSGSGAVIEIGTVEPRDLESGRILIGYDPAIAAGLPVVATDPRFGEADLTVTFPVLGRVQVDFVAPSGDFNRVPGGILTVTLPTKAGIPIGTISPLSIFTGIGESALFAPGAQPVAVGWEASPIEFVSDTTVFRDGFDSGDATFWVVP